MFEDEKFQNTNFRVKKVKKLKKLKLSVFSARIRFFLFLVFIFLTIVVFIVGFYNFSVAILLCLAIFFVWFYGFLIFLQYDRNKLNFLNQLLFNFESKGKVSFLNFPLPVVACFENGVVFWHNDSFEVDFNFENDCVGTNLSDLLNLPLKKIFLDKGSLVRYKNKIFKVYGRYSKNAGIYIFIFKDITKFQMLQQKFEYSKMCVCYVAIDNYREILVNRKDSEKSAIVGRVDDLLENFVDEHEGIMQKYREDEFFIVLKQKNLDKIIKNKFSILQIVKNSMIQEKNCELTISIGVGGGSDSFSECKQFAFQALDMALGRGGDQAAVKTPSFFKFFGGNSKELYKSSRVKARVVARAFLELVKNASNVVIMGHKFADLDSSGAAVGLALVIRKLNKESFVAVNYSQNLSKNLFEKVKMAGYADIVVDLDVAMNLIDLNTLLIIVDTHSYNLIDSPEIYKSCKNVVVIDHHRKAVDCISSAVIFYHEPYASSTCELVCELVQQFGYEKLIGPIEAQVFLAGIMLDTKNFAIKSGVRTFEAAAYLKRCGADTTEVKKMFVSSFAAYDKKTKIVMNARMYSKCAIAISSFKTDDMRIIAPQAADELLGIEGVDASFVIYELELSSTVYVTARSMGKFNVQVIMEHFGGGGHQLQAACQVLNSDVNRVYELLLHAIDEFLN